MMCSRSERCTCRCLPMPRRTRTGPESRPSAHPTPPRTFRVARRALCVTQPGAHRAEPRTSQPLGQAHPRLRACESGLPRGPLPGSTLLAGGASGKFLSGESSPPALNPWEEWGGAGQGEGRETPVDLGWLSPSHDVHPTTTTLCQTLQLPSLTVAGARPREGCPFSGGTGSAEF